MWLNHRMNLVDCISHITSCLVKPLWSPSYRNRFLSNRIMSKETLVSKVGSCNSLTAGTNACAQIAGLRLDGMDVGALRKTLQDSWGVMWNHALLCIYHIYIYIYRWSTTICSQITWTIYVYIRVYCPSWIVCISNQPPYMLPLDALPLMPYQTCCNLRDYKCCSAGCPVGSCSC